MMPKPFVSRLALGFLTLFAAAIGVTACGYGKGSGIAWHIYATDKTTKIKLVNNLEDREEITLFSSYVKDDKSAISTEKFDLANLLGQGLNDFAGGNSRDKKGSYLAYYQAGLEGDSFLDHDTWKQFFNQWNSGEDFHFTDIDWQTRVGVSSPTQAQSTSDPSKVTIDNYKEVSADKVKAKGLDNHLYVAPSELLKDSSMNMTNGPSEVVNKNGSVNVCYYHKSDKGNDICTASTTEKNPDYSFSHIWTEYWNNDEHAKPKIRFSTLYQGHDKFKLEWDMPFTYSYFYGKLSEDAKAATLAFGFTWAMAYLDKDKNPTGPTKADPTRNLYNLNIKKINS